MARNRFLSETIDTIRLLFGFRGEVRVPKGFDVTEWRTVKDGDREVVLKVLARHGIRVYEGYPLAGLSDDELKDVYATYVLSEWRKGRGTHKAHVARVIERLKRTQVLP